MKPWELLFVVVLLVLALSACGKKRLHIYELKAVRSSEAGVLTLKKYSVDLDEYRRRHHIPKVPDSFVLYRHGIDFASWRNELGSTVFPRYDNKLIAWSVDSLMTDRSYFFGPQKEEMIVAYVLPDTGQVYYWSAAMGASGKPKDFELTEVQVDSVLRAWGLGSVVR